MSDTKFERYSITKKYFLDVHIKINKLQATNARLLAALEAIIDLPGELNTENYSHDDVRFLNNSFIEAFQIAKKAIAEAKGI